jgi:hypothetical protein
VVGSSNVGKCSDDHPGPPCHLGPPSGAPSSSPLLPVFGGVVAALIGAIAALTVASLTRRASEQRWRLEAKRQGYTEVLSEAARIVRLIRNINQICEGSTLDSKKELEIKVEEYMAALAEAEDRVLEQGHLLSVGFLQAFNTFHTHLKDNVSPLVLRAVSHQLLGQQGAPEGLFAAYQRGADLLRYMRENASGDVGIFEGDYWKLLQRHRESQK